MLTRKSTYDEVYRRFVWSVPEYYNIGVDVCDKWAEERTRLALIYEDEEGKFEKFTFYDLKGRLYPPAYMGRKMILFPSFSFRPKSFWGSPALPRKMKLTWGYKRWFSESKMTIPKEGSFEVNRFNKSLRVSPSWNGS